MPTERRPVLNESGWGMRSEHRSTLEPEQLFSPFDRALGLLRERLFGRHRLLTVTASFAVYAGSVLALGPRLGVSTNYFVLIPVITASIGYGLAAGALSGILALPANLALYALLRHPEYSPASKIIAELSGVFVGTILGYLSDYHKKLDMERMLRKEIERELRTALRDRETLFREVHHRVKNNLNLIKSIIGLQSRRSSDQAFKDAAAALTGRLMSISFVHERLYRTAELSSVAIDDYLKDLVGAISMAASGSRKPPTVALELARSTVTMDVAVPIGLIVNELVTNALKHGRPCEENLRIEVSLHCERNRLVLAVRDDGLGFQGLGEEYPLRIEDAAVLNKGRLGLTLLELMSTQLGGTATYRRDGGWTEFRLDIPAGAPV